jgi:beta-lactamase class D
LTWFLFSACAAILVTTGHAQNSNDTLRSVEMPELSSYFKEYNVIGSFILYELNRDQYIRYNPERCRQEFLPASTFKILNSLIALETGVIKDENHTLKWDGTKRAVPAWNQDHNLKTAFQNSAVWYYQEIARQVGEARMKEYVTKAQYGNMDIAGGIDNFWLEGKLRITPEQQIDFLKKLYHGRLPFSERAMSLVKAIMLLEETPKYKLRGKTGWADSIGWLVGYLEQGDNVYFYATNIESENPDNNFGKARYEITKNILRKMNLLEP